MKFTASKPSQNHRGTEDPTMVKILQEIKTIKTAFSMAHGPARVPGQTWAAAAKGPEVASTTLRIQNEEEKKEISKLSSEELVEKIGMKEIVGARSMTNGQIKIFFPGDETWQIMEKQRDWTQKLAPTAQNVSRSYQVLLHDMPLTFDPDNHEHIRNFNRLTPSIYKGLLSKGLLG
ncbi:hypothetical protein EV44_g3555 [Erysiphe necator]|uniref:Uncharacterized protein n=1 Tax=Uncinula necator TaxID=52586 RepID=A0A0B1P2J1_UNCNE|nr:hypothetical protein EV44_g3555 [Erysiphe necator]